ncbi:hypothetical protein [Shewanella algidipiscicola]|uniref:hypothetical protein n=1 Tax=Shewanella algidipiscicola TaxID=614070 RepID=UPI000D78B517|nr:hypothetical protein [Shewanella algidipiscicola]
MNLDFIFEELDGVTEGVGSAAYEADGYMVIPFKVHNEKFICYFHAVNSESIPENTPEVIEQLTGRVPDENAVVVKFSAYIPINEDDEAEQEHAMLKAIIPPELANATNPAFRAVKAVFDCIVLHEKIADDPVYIFTPMTEKHGSLYSRVADRYAAKLNYVRIVVNEEELGGCLYVYEKAN